MPSRLEHLYGIYRLGSRAYPYRLYIVFLQGPYLVAWEGRLD